MKIPFMPKKRAEGTPKKKKKPESQLDKSNQRRKEYAGRLRRRF